MRISKQFSIGRFCCLGLLLMSVGVAACKKEETGDGSPPPVKVVSLGDMNTVSVDANRMGQFPIVTAESMETATQISATGSVTPDVARQVPVISLANGRVVDIKGRLGDHVNKGQLLLRGSKHGRIDCV